MKKQLSNIWLKSSVLGCLWASSEIVLGSFLHNLRVPFTGNILTAIGIIIMVSMGQVWTERGLFWRAGLICALMKSISPSAIIFGPMLAIFMESLLMELSTIVFRKSIIAFLVGGALAMSWNLFQVLMNYVVLYGPDIIRLYESITMMFQKQLGISSTDYYWPIKIILLFYVAFGLFSAAIGLYVGRKAWKKESNITTAKENIVVPKLRSQEAAKGKFSLWWLLLNIALMIGALIAFNYRNMLISAAVVIFISAIWIIRYPKVLRPLGRPGFWLFLVVTTTLSAYLLTSLTSGKNNGWIIGLEMNLRAVVMILGFAVTGRELRNPLISIWSHKAGFRQLPGAMELAFESLPAVVEYLPSWKNIIRNPFSTFSSYIFQAERLMKMHTANLNNDNRIILLTGQIGQGKSTFLTEVVHQLKEKNIKVGGFVANAVFIDGERAGYDLMNIENNIITRLAMITANNSLLKAGKYYFFEEGIEAGKTILSPENTIGKDIIVIDEIGPMELGGGGWADSVTRLLNETSCTMIWVVRRNIIDEVKARWDIETPMIIDIAIDKKEETVIKIIEIANMNKLHQLVVS